jgi:hypothetical protein
MTTVDELPDIVKVVDPIARSSVLIGTMGTRGVFRIVFFVDKYTE